MSPLKPHELEPLLADAANGGAYVIDVDDRTAMAEIGCAMGLRVIAIDLAGCTTKHEVLGRFADALAFPAWFGDNWDALADCLVDLSWLPPGGYMLLIDHAARWREASPEEFTTLTGIVDESAARWAADGIAFWALVPLSARCLAASATSDAA